MKESIECANESCNVTFPFKYGKRFCSTKCRNEHNNRSRGVSLDVRADVMFYLVGLAKRFGYTREGLLEDINRIWDKL